MTKSECLDCMRLMLDEYEERAIKAENQLQAILSIEYGPPTTMGSKSIAKFCGVEIDEAAKRVCQYPDLKRQVESAKRALEHMLYAYKRKQSVFPSEYERSAVREAQIILGIIPH